MNVPSRTALPYCICPPHDGRLYHHVDSDPAGLVRDARWRGASANFRTLDGYVPHFAGVLVFPAWYVVRVLGAVPTLYPRSGFPYEAVLEAAERDGYGVEAVGASQYANECEWRVPRRGVRFDPAMIEYVWVKNAEKALAVRAAFAAHGLDALLGRRIRFSPMRSMPRRPGSDSPCRSKPVGLAGLPEARPRNFQQAALHRLMKETRWYGSYRDFAFEWSAHGFRGQYWHLTDDPAFRPSTRVRPWDASSAAADDPGPTFVRACAEGGGALMVTSHPDHWLGQLRTRAGTRGRRPFAAELDLSDLKPGVEFRHVGRGFGHEMWIPCSRIPRVRVVRVVTAAHAVREERIYRTRTGPQNERELYILWCRGRRAAGLACGPVPEFAAG